MQARRLISESPRACITGVFYELHVKAFMDNSPGVDSPGSDVDLGHRPAPEATLYGREQEDSALNPELVELR